MASGLGLVLAPRTMARLYGLPELPLLLRALGARDLAIGLGLVVADEWRPWMLARGASELCDGALIGVAALSGRRAIRRLIMANGAILLGVAESGVACAAR